MKVYLVSQAWFRQLQKNYNILFDDGKRKEMGIYLAGLSRMENQLSLLKKWTGGDEDMQLYLAGVAPWREEGLYTKTILDHKPYILESFFYADEMTKKMIPHYGDFLLDSGAFTFMKGKGHTDWDEYVERYADFINENNVKKFFELDIDSVVGYDEVLRLRAKLEKLTNRRSIPVWHANRGWDGYIRMCDEYDYVSIGSNSQNDKVMPAFIHEAHKRGAKIHGLGYTKLTQLHKMHFDSVDSTAWTTGNRFGYVYYFDGKTMKKRDVPPGKRISDSKKVALINYIEWIKFQKYAEVHL